MKINGNPASGGTIVIAPGQSAEIDLPIGSVLLDFQTDSGASRIEMLGGKIVFFNADNALGSAVNPTLSGPGFSFRFAAVVYAVGEGENTYRVVHYTV